MPSGHAVWRVHARRCQWAGQQSKQGVGEGMPAVCVGHPQMHLQVPPEVALRAPAVRGRWGPEFLTCPGLCTVNAPLTTIIPGVSACHMH